MTGNSTPEVVYSHIKDGGFKAANMEEDLQKNQCSEPIATRKMDTLEDCGPQGHPTGECVEDVPIKAKPLDPGQKPEALVWLREGLSIFTMYFTAHSLCLVDIIDTS